MRYLHRLFGYWLTTSLAAHSTKYRLCMKNLYLILTQLSNEYLAHKNIFLC